MKYAYEERQYRGKVVDFNEFFESILGAISSVSRATVRRTGDTGSIPVSRSKILSGEPRVRHSLKFIITRRD